jgi:hypothetical protein
MTPTRFLCSLRRVPLLRPSSADPSKAGSNDQCCSSFPPASAPQWGLAVFLLGMTWTLPLSAQPRSGSPSSGEPTIENPVQVQVEPAQKTVAPGSRSALLVTFKLPKFMWLGAKPSQARTPAGTKIEMEGPSGFQFEPAHYPDTEVEGLPVHLGLTNVYMGRVQIVVPFRVASGANAGTYDLTARITYTPGFNAGNLTTHDEELYSTTVRVENGGAERPSDQPSPSVADVPNEFRVQADKNPFVSSMEPMLHRYDESSAFTSFMHTLFNDPDGHNKILRHAPFPFFESTNTTGTNIGGGITFLNSTQEGVMTGSLSLQTYHNEFLGPGVGFDYTTCPAAYKNLRVSARTGFDDQGELHVKWEDFTFGPDDRWGVQVDASAQTDPRTRFHGLGSGTDGEDLHVYDHEEIGGTIDFYHLPIEKFRVGLGLKARTVAVEEGLFDIDDDDVEGRFVPSVVKRNGTVDDDFEATPGINGATVLGGRFNVIFDARNQEFNPSSGFFGKFTAELDQVTDDGGNALLADNYGRFDLTLRQYFSTVDRRITLVLRGKGTATTREDVPFFEQATLGGLRSLRGFDKNRFYGQHSVYGSVELRYTPGNITFMGFPFAMKMNAFLDGGQVFSDSDELFNDEFNVNPGLGLRMSNPPNVGFTSNIAFGQDGINFSGGITLPI